MVFTFAKSLGNFVGGFPQNLLVDSNSNQIIQIFWFQIY